MEPKAEETAGPSGPSGSEQAELVPAEVPAGLLEQMLEMGFPRNRAIRAIHFSGGETIEQALNWFTENEDAEDIDEPLLVKPKKELTPEEKKHQMEELRKKAKEKREREEKESERIRERERIRMGKELQAAEQKQKEQELQKRIEQRKREKEEDRVAKEKIRMKLEEDRKERRKKLGLPEELTAEEKAKEEEKRQAKLREDEENARKHVGFAKPVGITDKLRKSLLQMKSNSSDAQFKTACGVLLKYVGNVASNPDEEKFRRIRLANAAFQQKVAVVSGSFDFLVECGFELDHLGEHLVMKRDAVEIPTLEAAGTVLDNAVNNPFFGSL